MKYSRYNAIIIGSGISGLYLANKLSLNNKFKEGILIITKEELFSGSSSLAQGGIVCVIPEINKKDSIESHIKDTIKAGCGINNLQTIKLVSEKSSEIAQELISYGVNFDKNENNSLNFTLEGAHSCPRILHSQGDSTGKVIEEALCRNLQKTNNLELYTNTMAVELLVDDDNTCKGIISYNWLKNEYEVIYSNNIIIATGGIGQLYKETTNPKTQTGDGIALAYNAGAKVEDMEFVQFHPTAMYIKNHKKSMPLVSESVRGEGAKLVDLDGNYFAKNYHIQADLAPRDIVSRAIIQQMELTETDYVNLDISQIGIEKFKQRFPTILKLLNENNIDIQTGLIPVKPAQHYFMGGIKVNLNCETEIKNLYAIGECASTGLHGANRLASNSLLECCVFANLLADKIAKNNTEPPKIFGKKIKSVIDKYSNEEDLQDCTAELNILFGKLQDIMSADVAIRRNYKGLSHAINQIKQIKQEIISLNPAKNREFYELNNALCCAELITQSAIERKNSIGAHYREDYPHKSIEIKERKINYEQILSR